MRPLFILILNVSPICPGGALEVGFCVTLMSLSFFDYVIAFWYYSIFQVHPVLCLPALVSFPHFHHSHWVIIIYWCSQWTELVSMCINIMTFLSHLASACSPNLCYSIIEQQFVPLEHSQMQSLALSVKEVSGQFHLQLTNYLMVSFAMLSPCVCKHCLYCIQTSRGSSVTNFKPWIKAAHAFSTIQTEKLEMEITQLDFSCYFETQTPHIVKCGIAERNVNASAYKTHWIVHGLSFHRPFAAVFPLSQQSLRNEKQSTYFHFLFYF